jgi:hypothetical protein
MEEIGLLFRPYARPASILQLTEKWRNEKLLLLFQTRFNLSTKEQ